MLPSSVCLRYLVVQHHKSKQEHTSMSPCSGASPVGVSYDLMLPLGPLWGRPQRGPNALVRALLVFQRFGADGDSKLYNTIIRVPASTDDRTPSCNRFGTHRILVRFLFQVPGSICWVLQVTPAKPRQQKQSEEIDTRSMLINEASDS